MRSRFRLAALVAGAAGLVATSLLTTSAIANASTRDTATAASARAARLPISARQMLADRRLHDSAAQGTGAITGSAKAADGQPLDGVCVSAYGPSGHSLAATRPDGRYLLTGLKPGAYQVRYSGCGDTSQYLSQWYGGAVQRNAARSVVVSASALRPLAPVTMRTLAGESPTANVIDPATPSTAARSLRVALGLPAYGSAGRALPAATAAASSGGRISGVVRNPSGRGLSGICVEAVAGSGLAASFVHTGKGGRYETARLPAGTYFVAFYADCGNTGNWIAQAYDNASLAKPTPIHIHRGKTTSGVDATLKLGGEISGTVTNASGAKLSGICAEPVGSAKNYAALFVGAVSERGTYHLRGLPGGPYKIEYALCGASDAYAPVWWPHAATEQAAKTIRLKQRQVLGHVNEVIPVGGVISGTVTNSSSTPVSGICVFATPNGPDAQFLAGFQVTTNAAGQYKIIGLSPASYTVQFATGCGNNGNYLTVNYPTAVSVTYGQTRAGINIQLPSGAIVSGTVTSAATGKAVGGICVSLNPESDTNYFDGNATTSTAGTYRIDQVPAGTYYVQFSGGCGNTGSYAPQAYDNASEYLPQPIAVTAGQSVNDIDAAMQPGATITGTARSQARRGLSGICVLASSTSNDGLGTSKDGRYTVANLLPGQYGVYFSTGCGNNADLAAVSFGSQSSPPVVSAPAGTTSGIDAVLPTAGNISGQILTRSGRRVAACVLAIPNSALASGQAVGIGGSQQAGSYADTNLAPGLYAVNFDPGCFFPSAYASQWYKDRPSLDGAARVRVRAGHTVTGINSALVKGGSITGRVTTGGKPVNGVCVYAQSPGDFGQATTNKAGKYDMTGLNSGRYEVEFYPCDEGRAALAQTLLTRLVTVRVPHVTTGVNAALALGGDITGTVLGGSPASPQPDVCVEADETSALAANAATTGANGEFTITNLPAGKYQVDIGGCGVVSDLAPQWYQDAQTRGHATVVSVSSGKVTALASVTLSTNGAITGMVTGPSHAALAGICVTVSSDLLPQPVVAVSGASGAYTLLGLPPTNYRVQFSSGCGASGYRTQWWDGKKSAATAGIVKVTAATSTTGVNATMQK